MPTTCIIIIVLLQVWGGKFNTLKYTSLHSSSSYFTGLRVVSSIVWNAQVLAIKIWIMVHLCEPHHDYNRTHFPQIPVSLGVTCSPHHFSENFTVD